MVSFLLVHHFFTGPSRIASSSAPNGSGSGSTVVTLHGGHGHAHHDEFPHSPLQSHRRRTHLMSRRRAAALPGRGSGGNSNCGSRRGASNGNQARAGSGPGAVARAGPRSRAAVGGATAVAVSGADAAAVVAAAAGGWAPQARRPGVLLGVLAPVRPGAPPPLVGGATAAAVWCGVAVPAGRRKV